jgi:uncharacterized protein YcbK (DUF882 family)
LVNILNLIRGRRSNISVWMRLPACLLLVMGAFLMAAPAAKAEVRSLKLYHLHTHEKAEIVFKRNGRYDQAGLKKINHILRDWRRNEPVKIDPRLLDLVWEAYKATGSHEYINVICGYRAPATNSMLRSRSKGVAKKSQHMIGRALDFYIPGVNLKKLRNIGLKMQGGGVGYYPRSGSPFVHFDVGNVRHWPGISRQELASVFPNGKTLHVPSDGKPLPGYEQALASYKSRKSRGEPAIALASAGGSSRAGGLLSAIFGGGQDEADDNAEAEIASAEAPPRAKPAPSRSSGQIRVVPPELAQRATAPAEVPEKDVIVAALPERGAPLPELAPRPKRDVGAPIVDLNAAVKPLIDLGPEAEQPVAPATEIALNIPLPSWRPDVAATGDAATDTFTVASAGPMTVEDALKSDASPLPSMRPTAAQAVFASTLLPDTVTAVPQIAAYAEPEPQPRPFMETPAEIATPTKGARVASMETTASLRTLLTHSAKGSDPAKVMRSNVHTTAKSDRPNRADSKPDPRPVVIAAQPQAARWALDNDYVKNNTKGTTAPSFAYRIVRSAPREVYNVGFQNGGNRQLAAANKFSGKAVTFIPVARFN